MSKADNYEEYIYSILCPDWDDMAIDETCGEFASCGCFRDNQNATKLKDEQNDLIDASMEKDMVR